MSDTTRGEVAAGEPWSCTADDGTPLSGRLFRGDDTGERAVLLLGALAAPQRYLRHTAAWLSGRGYGVATFDYRGVGASSASGGPATNLDDWASDVRGAIAAAREAFGARRLLVLGHSLGGMLFGHAGVGDDAVSGAVFVASTHAVPRYYRGPMRLLLGGAYAFLPPLSRVMGELPGWRWIFGSPVPRDVLVHWTRWGREARFVRWDGTPSAPAFRRYGGPLLGVSLADDPYAPAPAVDGLLAQFERAGTRRVVVDPAREHDGRTGLGHFGLFRPQAPLWARLALLGWLQSVEEAASPGSSDPAATLRV